MIDCDRKLQIVFYNEKKHHVDKDCYRYLHTWANQPYTEVGKSGHRTADLGSSNHTFFRGLELPTLAVLWPRCRTADLGSSMASFQHFRTFRHRTADLGSSMAAFQHFAQSLILKMS